MSRIALYLFQEAKRFSSSRPLAISSSVLASLLLAMSAATVFAQAGAPSIVSVSPNAGFGASQIFTAVYSDPNGFADLATVRFLLNTSIQSAATCYVMYTPAQNAMYLENDVGNGVSAALTPGSSSSVSNSQCTLSGVGSSVSGSGNNMTVTYALSFSNTFATLEGEFLLAGSKNGESSGWVNTGDFTTSNMRVSPVYGHAVTQVFTAIYADPHGTQDLNTVQILFNSAVKAANGCYAQYDPAQNVMYLENDAGTGTSAPLTPGSSDSVSNSQCTLSGAASSVSSSGNDLTVNYGISFSNSFITQQNLYLMAVSSTAGDGPGWVLQGTWTANTLPAVVSISPGSGFGDSQSFTAVYYDPYGVTDLASVRFLLGNRVQSENVCYVIYIPAQNALYGKRCGQWRQHSRDAGFQLQRKQQPVYVVGRRQFG